MLFLRLIRRCTPALAGVAFCITPLQATGPAVWALPNIQQDAEETFLKAANDFLVEEDLSPEDVTVELQSLRSSQQEGTTGNWRALAQVFVDEKPGGDYVKRLVFDRDYWLNPAESRRYQDHRWVKLMWHEIHHLRYFPMNLRRARELMRNFPAAGMIHADVWERRWVTLLEPMEEVAAETACIKRYRETYGPLPEALLSDSRGDMRKHSARYKKLLAGILADALHPDEVLKSFPSELPVDTDGNILP